VESFGWVDGDDINISCKESDKNVHEKISIV
jgi:hypothetical protein